MKGRPYVFPSPNDVTPNNPGVIVNPGQVIGIYNQSPDNKDGPMKNVTDKVRQWFEAEAKRIGWDEAKFIGSQCALARTDLTIKEPTE